MIGRKHDVKIHKPSGSSQIRLEPKHRFRINSEQDHLHQLHLSSDKIKIRQE